MKILHTADLHIGKTIYESSQADRQAKMLDDICSILADDDYAALIIAGDIYDRSIPSAEAVSLFNKFFSNIRKANPHTSIFIIPGNHDSAERLAFGADIFKMESIFIVTNTENICTPITINHNDEQAQFFLLPFLHLGSFLKTENKNAGDDFKLDSQSAMAEEAAFRFKKVVNNDLPSVLVAHLFTLNGVTSSSERTFLGTAELINPEIFNFFSYVALGHLHKMQKVTDRMYYSGSTLTYSFDECDTEKVVLSVDVDCKTKGFPIKVEKIPIIPLKKMSRIEGSFNDVFMSQKFDSYKDDLLEIYLTDNEVTKSAMPILQSKFPYLLNLHQASVNKKITEDDNISSEVLKKDLESAETIFESYHNFQKVIETQSNEKKDLLFKKLCTKNMEE